MGFLERSTELMSRAAEAFDLPPDLVAGLPHMELLGDREFLMEGHRGILSYDNRCIVVATGMGAVQVQVEGLELLCMNEGQLRIGGRLDRVEIVR